MTTVERLGAEEYVSLTSYRRDGTPVATPLWVVRDGATLAVWTPTESYKVKRIRRNPTVTVAACDIRGRLRGEPVDGRAEVLSAADTERVRELIRRKYGLRGRLTLFGSRLRRGRAGTTGIRIRLDGRPA
jgi:hypothetical protein